MQQVDPRLLVRVPRIRVSVQSGRRALDYIYPNLSICGLMKHAF